MRIEEKIKKGIGEIHNYTCGFCGNKFEHFRQRNEKTKDDNAWSSMIKCPRCGNFCKTWKQ